MDYWTDILSPTTYEQFSQTDRTIIGVPHTRRSAAQKVKAGDKLVAYLIKVKRFVGVIKILEGPFEDSTPRFGNADDPYIIRFRAETEVWLPPEKTIPIKTREIFSRLSFTRNVREDGYWIGPFRSALAHLSEADGAFLEQKLREQAAGPIDYGFDAVEYGRLLKSRVTRPDGQAAVAIPSEPERGEGVDGKQPCERESTQIQAKLCELGERMGMKIWLPPNDRSRVCSHWHPKAGSLLDRLPLNFEETTLKTFEWIDVLWLDRQAVCRAFEVEHSTAVYSGLLRMADLCALLPNLNIALHIVAPDVRTEKVFEEITRPVFATLQGAPLSKRCTYLSYSSVRKLAALPHLSHCAHRIVDEYVDQAL